MKLRRPQTTDRYKTFSDLVDHIVANIQVLHSPCPVDEVVGDNGHGVVTEIHVPQFVRDIRTAGKDLPGHERYLIVTYVHLKYFGN